MDAISLVPMCEEHLDGMAELEQACFSMPWSRAMLADELTNSYAMYYVAEDSGGRVAGYAGMHMILDEGHITNVAVSPDMRRRGIASALMDKLLRVAERGGIKHVTLEVRDSNRGAIELYMKKGFKPVAVRKDYYTQPREDGVLMIKDFENINEIIFD